jgi:hypothetical protein
MNPEFENGHLVAALVRSVGGYQSEKRTVRVHLIVNHDARPMGYTSCPTDSLILIREK